MYEGIYGNGQSRHGVSHRLATWQQVEICCTALDDQTHRHIGFIDYNLYKGFNGLREKATYLQCKTVQALAQLQHVYAGDSWSSDTAQYFCLQNFDKKLADQVEFFYVLEQERNWTWLICKQSNRQSS